MVGHHNHFAPIAAAIIAILVVTGYGDGGCGDGDGINMNIFVNYASISQTMAHK